MSGKWKCGTRRLTIGCDGASKRRKGVITNPDSDLNWHFVVLWCTKAYHSPKSCENQRTFNFFTNAIILLTDRMKKSP